MVRCQPKPWLWCTVDSFPYKAFPVRWYIEEVWPKPSFRNQNGERGERQNAIACGCATQEFPVCDSLFGVHAWFLKRLVSLPYSGLARSNIYEPACLDWNQKNQPFLELRLRKTSVISMPRSKKWTVLPSSVFSTLYPESEPYSAQIRFLNLLQLLNKISPMYLKMKNSIGRWKSAFLYSKRVSVRSSISGLAFPLMGILSHCFKTIPVKLPRISLTTSKSRQLSAHSH